MIEQYRQLAAEGRGELMYSVIGFILVMEVFRARKGQPVLASTLFSALFLIALWFVDASALLPYFVALACVAGTIDGYKAWNIPQAQKKYWVGLNLVLAVAFGLFLGSRPAYNSSYEVRASELVAHYGDEQQAVKRDKLRIVEFHRQGDTEWHVKDGKNIISFDDNTPYANSRGKAIGGEEIIRRIEAWAGVTREQGVLPLETTRVTRGL